VNGGPADYLPVLQAHDDPVYWEVPPGFDWEAAEQHFLAFAHELEQTLGVSCLIEAGALIQDASFLGQIMLPEPLVGKASTSGAPVLLRVSNWGQMATLTNEEALEPAVLEQIKAMLGRFSYVYIPPSVLELPYTGNNPGVTGIRTWWIRYLDWV
jgi:hypothetical protein